MKAVIQRVSRAKVVVEGREVATIGPGILTLLGVAKGDTREQLTKLVTKICELRIFEDADGKMNRCLREAGGAHLIVSQFTLLGDTSQGRRPGFTGAEAPERARELYEEALKISAACGVPTSGGTFQAHMAVELVNDGPATFLIEA